MKKIGSLLLMFCILLPSSVNLIATEFSFNNDYLSGGNIEVEDTTSVVQEFELTSNYELVSSTNDLEMYVDFDTAKIVVYDINADYYWFSSPEIKGKLNDTWINTINSPFNISYTVDEDIIQSASMFDEASSFEIEKIEDGVVFHNSFLDGDITFDGSIILNAQGMEVSILGDSILDSDTSKLVSISVLPYFGAVFEDLVPGYGVSSYGYGAKINYEKADSKIGDSFSGFSTPDMTYAYESYLVSMPLFGAVHGENSQAFSSYIKKGDLDAKQVAMPSGYLTGYTTIYNEYTYSYRYEEKLNEEKKLVKFSDSLNYDVVQQYDFLSSKDAGYDGIALSYQNYLEEVGILTDQPIEYSTLVEVLATNEKKALVGTNTVEMTTFEELEVIANNLSQSGAQVDFEIRNFIDESASYYSLFQMGNISKTIDPKYQDSLMDTLKLNGQNISYVYDFNYALLNDKNINQKNDALKTATGEYYKEEGLMILNSDILSRIESQLIEQLNTNKIKTVTLALPKFSSDPKNINSRYNYNSNIDSFLASLTAQGITYNLDSINSVNEIKGSEYVKINLNQINHPVFDESIGLVPIVLSGHVKMFSYNLNQMSIDQDLLLKLIEYNIYPNFEISGASAEEFSNTTFEYNSLSTYEYFEPIIKEVDSYVSDALSDFSGLEIVSRDVILRNVVEVTYEDGNKIIINYNGKDVVTKDGTVKAKDYLKVGVTK